MELDLYWFDHDNLDASVDAFWNRFAPLYRNVSGERGVILNVGWTVGYIMEWNGDPAQHITLPAGTGQQPWVPETGPLTGDTEARRIAWKERFANPVMVPKSGYGNWTYGELGTLAARLRATGKTHGVDGFKVGTLVYAWDNAYGELAPWFSKHPEAFSGTAPHLPGRAYVSAHRFFDPGNVLHADDTRYAAYPHGYPEGTPVHEAFARQWGSLSQASRIDALMLRDSFGMMVPYSRRGRLGEVMPTSQDIAQTTDSAAALVRETKRANPKVTLMMYSNATSAVADWRSNGCDLERIAREGYLDVFVDQTWAGAWNEVGVRHNRYWNQPALGWTYQLAYTLLHGAMLADTKVKHYPLIETFDAWESWDVLHTVPERLRWGIWAYSHAGVKMPSGIRMPEGSYISWGNQGKRLLSPEDVAYLDTNISAAVRDASQTIEIDGPTLVYSRSAMQWQVDHAQPDGDIREWIDQQAGSIAKWPVPIQSATRLEWLSKVRSDLPIVQSPSHVTPGELTELLNQIEAGKPLAIFGSFAGGIDPKILRMSGIDDATPIEVSETIHQAANLAEGRSGDAFEKAFPVQVSLNHTLPSADVLKSKGIAVYYAVDNNAQLVRGGPNQNLLLWDPPDFRIQMEKPLRTIWGEGITSYAMTAAAVNELIRTNTTLHAEAIEQSQTSVLGSWQTVDGRRHILVGNVEEGLRDDADLSRHLTLALPAAWQTQWAGRWHDIAPATGQTLAVEQAPFTSNLIESR